MGIAASTTLDITVSDPSGYEYDVTFDAEAFASGKHRECYLGTLLNEKAPKHNKKVVLKVFKKRYVKDFNADYECVKDLERSIICHERCIEFNRAMDEYSAYTIPLSFPAPLRINIKRSLAQTDSDKWISKAFNSIPIDIKAHKYLTVQLLLKDSVRYKYQKLSSNNGWITIDPEYRFLSAFSHYSWVQSKGKQLITGFQGIQRGHVLFLSDAVVHSDALNHNGHHDLGIIGLINFFMNHECNECCKHLPTLDTTLLIEYLSTDSRSILNVNQSTSYVFELNEAQLKEDQQRLETVYTQLIHSVFDKKQDPYAQPQAGDVTVTDHIINDMEQIESVVEDMILSKTEDVEEEEVEDDSEYHDHEEEHQEVHIIHDNVDVSWFADDLDDESYAEHKDLYDLDANNEVNFVNIDAENDPNEWELI